MRETFFVSGASAGGSIGVSVADDGRRWVDDDLLKECGLVIVGAVQLAKGTPIMLATGA